MLGEKVIDKVLGNTSGLKKSEIQSLSRIYRRRIPPKEILTLELARTLSHITSELKKEITILINRRGKVDLVFVGDSYDIPFDTILERTREASYRLRGYRLIHTHIKNPDLSNSDLVTLVNERLDLIGVLHVSDRGSPGKIQIAYLLPCNPEGRLWETTDYNDLGGVDINFEEFIRGLESEIEKTYLEVGGTREKEGVYLIGVSSKYRSEAEQSLEELGSLARSANKAVLERTLQYRREIDPRYLIGKGKLQEVILRAKQVGAEKLIFDIELSPAQVKAISDQTNLDVSDRTQLILEIFAKRATTNEGKIQVRLAQLRYALPRLIGKGIELSQLGGGIGTKGPGEKKLEQQRRMLRKQIDQYERQIEQLRKRRRHTRKKRIETGIISATFIGYTNVGKSTLFNSITNSSVLVKNQLFSTLNPTTRKLVLPSKREILVTDTVGFIRNLPKELIKAFRATLEEMEDSFLLIHIVDASDPLLDETIESVEKILTSTGYDHIPRFIVYNKIDKAHLNLIEDLKRHGDNCLLSALDTSTLPVFLNYLDAKIDNLWQPSKKDKATVSL